MKDMGYPKAILRHELTADKVTHPVLARVVTALAVCGGIGMRFAQLGKTSLWFDEGYTAWAVSHPVGEIIRIIKADTAPPLFYILLRGWTHLFGFSEAALRSMSALMASAALLIFLSVARRLLQSPWSVVAAVTLFSFSFMQIAYAHEARFYTMMTLLEAIDLYLVLLMCQRSSILRLTGLTLAWIASLYTNNMMAVYLAALGIAWLVLPGMRKIRGRAFDLAIVSIISAISFAPWLPSLLSQTKRIQGAFWPDTPDGWLLSRTVGVMAGVHEQSLPRGDQHLFLIVIIVVFGLSLLACNTLARLRKVLAMLIAGVLPIVVIFVYSHVRQSIFMERAFLASGVIMPLLLVFAVDVVRSKAVRIVSALIVLVFIYLSFGSIPHRRLGEHPENWRDACAYVQQSQATHRLVICVSSDGEPLYRYYGCHRDYGPRADVTAVPASFYALDPPQTMQRVQSDRDLDRLRQTLSKGNFDEVVLIASHTWWGDRNERTLAFLSDNMHLDDERKFTGIVVFRFIPPY